MKANEHYLNNKKDSLFLPNYKFKKLKDTNNRYQNIQKSNIIPLNSNLSNNILVYESYNKKGYNGIVDPSLSGNNNYLIITDLESSPLKSKINKNKTFTKMSQGTSNSEIRKSNPIVHINAKINVVL